MARSTFTLQRDLYENCKVLSRDGEVMFYCSSKRANWYVKRNLGKVLNEDPLVVQLTFEANGKGNAGDKFYLQHRKNRCVVCGITKELTRHHVVPYSFRKFFPDEIKNHSYHDILPLCYKCHDDYERKADELKIQLEKEYNAPMHGSFDKEYYLGLLKCRGAASALRRHGDKIPQERKDFLLNLIKTTLKDDNPDLEKVSNLKFEADVQSQGEMIVRQLTDIESFVMRWRTHFVEAMQPKFMPDYWNVGRGVR